MQGWGNDYLPMCIYIYGYIYIYVCVCVFMPFVLCFGFGFMYVFFVLQSFEMRDSALRGKFPRSELQDSMRSKYRFP